MNNKNKPKVICKKCIHEKDEECLKFDDVAYATVKCSAFEPKNKPEELEKKLLYMIDDFDWYGEYDENRHKEFADKLLFLIAQQREEVIKEILEKSKLVVGKDYKKDNSFF